MNSRTKSLGWLVILLSLVITAYWQHPANKPLIDSNILNLLPKNQQDPAAQAAFSKLSSHMESMVFILVGHADKQQAIMAADALSKKMLSLPLFAQVNAKLSDQQQQAWVRFYAPAKAQLLTTAQRDRLRDFPEQQTQRARQTLYSPFSGVTGAELENDPFLLFREYLDGMNTQRTRFSIDDGFLITQHHEKYYVMLRATVSGSAYDLETQEQLADLHRAEQQVMQQFHSEVLHTGTVFYAKFGTDSARNEISTIGLGSLIGILTLVVVVYKSLLPLGLTLLAISSGIITACATTLLVFGQIHLFSLVMGASLIGVSIDYAFHYLTERLAVGEKWNAEKGLQAVWVAISFGLISTLIAYLSMLIAPFPGLQQLALFSSSGLIGAFLCVVCVYPYLAAAPSPSSVLPCETLGKRYLMLWENRLVRIIVPMVALIISAIGLVIADYNDDIKHLQAMPQTLQQQEQKITTITGLSSSQPMLLVKGADEQSLLETLYQLRPALGDLQNSGAISGYQNIADAVAPLSIQRENFALVQALYRAQSDALVSQLGLATVPVAPETFHPLLLRDFLDSDAGNAMQPLWLDQLETGFAAIIVLQGVNNQQAITTLLENNPSVTPLNKAQEISTLFGQYRIQISQLMAISCLIILAVLSLRFGVKRAGLILTPPLLAAGVALAAGALSDVQMNIFNLLALFLVLGIGIDYSLIFAEQKSSLRALVTNSLAAITTLLSFGLLSLSNTAAIHSFGVTVLVGIAVAWLLSPIAIAPVKESK